MNSYDSSFFHAKYSGKKVLILVPHQDDEINVAGNSIQNFTQQGAEVYIVFANSGDYYRHYDFETRMTEAVNSLKVLGIDKSRIIILGYGETFNNSDSGHIFYSPTEPVKSPAGRTETYGAIGIKDWRFFAHGEHSTYCRNDYLLDLREKILHVKADVIIATDFDYHADHRMLSLAFDSVMGEILSRPGNDYFPEVFRRFAYCTAYFAPQDFLDSDFILSTTRPQAGKTSWYDKDIIDTSYYSWPERVRIPVPENSRKPFAANIITEALKQHVSQGGMFFAESIINSDEVFWRRRTDSLSFSAKVTATSGNADYVHDFMLLNVEEIDSDAPDWKNYLWLPDENDAVKELVFTWDSPQEISQVRLWGNVDGLPVKRVMLTMNTGYCSEIGPLPEKGLPLTLNIPVQSGVTECRVRILERGSSESGFAEIEFFTKTEQPPVIQPFIQITTGGNFVYVYPRRPDELSIPVECYAYRCDSPVKYSVEGRAKLDGWNLVFEAGNDGDVVVTAEADGGLYCRSVFRTVSVEEGRRSEKIRRREKKRLKVMRFMHRSIQRVKIYSGIAAEKGIMNMLKKLSGKIVSKIRKKLQR